MLIEGKIVSLVPEVDFGGRMGTVPLDYERVAESAELGMRELLDEGLLELEVFAAVGRELRCRGADS